MNWKSRENAIVIQEEPGNDENVALLSVLNKEDEEEYPNDDDQVTAFVSSNSFPINQPMMQC